ncbi:bacteriophage protein [Mycolicibacterium rhodesiae JS60]|nr:bacteriophage protein [Mycolicibacterium rhodesiae JS60]
MIHLLAGAEQANPDDWKDMATIMFLGACPVIAAGLPLWFKMRKIDGQVSNTHDENLRDEITRGFKEIREDNREIRKDIGGLREELRTERKERIDGDRQREAA